MKAITLGYKTTDAKGPAVTIAGPEIPVSEQAGKAELMKQTRNYPPGIVRIEFCLLTPRSIGILIPQPAETKQETTTKKFERKKNEKTD